MQNLLYRTCFILFIVICMIGISVPPVLSAEGQNSGLDVDSVTGYIELDFTHNEYTFDPEISDVTPYWFLVILDKEARLGLLQFIEKMDISEKERDSILLSIKKLWDFYPVTIDKNHISLASEEQKTPLSSEDEENFKVLLTALGAAMEESIKDQPQVKFLGPQHSAIIGYACDHYPKSEPYNEIANITAPDPDYWDYPLGRPYNHGYVPSLGLGLAPENCNRNATQAKDKFNHNETIDAFSSLGHSSHFLVDLGNPMHTGAVGEQFLWEWILGIPIHTEYEAYVNEYWDNGFTFSQYAINTVTKYTVTDPEESAISLAQYSDNYSDELVTLVENNWLKNYRQTGEGKFTLEDVPRIRTITQNTIIETTKYTNGLVDYVIRDGPIQFTIIATAGEHGSITPSGDVILNYGDDQTFTIEPESGFTTNDVVVDGVSRGALSEYTFEDVTADHTISATFRESFCSMLTFTDANFKSSTVQYFNSGETVPAGTFTLDVTGWNSQWYEDHGWWEEGVTDTTFKSAVWRNMTTLWIEGATTPLSELVLNGVFAHEDSFGNATVTLSSPSRVGIVIIDNPYSDNRGAATIVLRDAGSTCSGTMMKQSVNILPEIADFGNTTSNDDIAGTEATSRS